MAFPAPLLADSETERDPGPTIQWECARLRRPLAGGGVVLLPLLLLIGLSSYSPLAAQGTPPIRREVLQLVAWSGDVPAWLQLSQAFRQQVANNYPGEVEFYTEYMEVARFSGPRYESQLAGLLHEKYRGRLHMIAVSGAPALEFALRHRQELWPGVPIVFSGLEPRDVERRVPMPGVTGVTAVVDLKGSLDAALTLQPETRHVFVTAGTLEVDQFRVAQARREFEAYRNRVEFTYLTDLSMADLTTRVGRLPSRSIVLVLHFFKDGSGQVFRPFDAFKTIANASNMPVYGVLDTYMGAGMVGGRVVSWSEIGSVAGELAARVLAGEIPDSMAIRALEAEPVYDWRELARWGLSPRRVPPGAVMRFREPSVWERYRWYIVGAVVFSILQTALIASLMVQRSARWQARRSLEKQVQFLRLVVEFSSSSARLTTGDVDRWINAWLNRLGVFLGVDRATLVEERYGALRCTHEWSADSQEPFSPMFADELPWTLSALRRGEGVQIGRLVELPAEAATDREAWQRRGVKSLLATPLVEHDSTKGTLLLSALRSERIWPDEVVTHLRLIGDIFAGAFALRRAETAMRASDQMSRTLLGAMSGPTAVLDRESNVLSVNGGWEALTREPGTSPLPWVPVGGNLREVCRRAGTEASLSPYVALDGVEAVLRGDAEEFRLKYDWEAPTGHRYVELVAAPLVRPEGGAVISHIDQTDRERAARELQDLRQTVAHSGRIMSLGEMSASLAHELNQPLTAILSNVQAAKRFLATRPHNLAEIHEILVDIEEDNQRAGEIIRRLRTMIRKGHTDRQQLLLNDHVQEVADLISADARLRHIAVVLDLDPGLPAIHADRVQLSQVILNLTLNGADAMETTIPEERELLLRTWRYNNESVALSVRDRGAGITAKPVDQIFEPYYSSKREGLGLGLSIARSIVEAHGGWIRAANNPDRGATLLLVLPIDGKKTQ